MYRSHENATTRGARLTQFEALLLSIGIEAAVAWPLVAGLRWGHGPRAALAAAVGTLLTHWAAWAGFQQLYEQFDYAPTLVVVEGCVIAAEWAAYRLIVPLPAGRALLASAIVNASSTLIGVALYALDLA